MKRKVLVMLVVLLTANIVATMLVGCNNEEPKEPLLGKWYHAEQEHEEPMIEFFEGDKVIFIESFNDKVCTYEILSEEKLMIHFDDYEYGTEIFEYRVDNDKLYLVDLVFERR